MRPTGYQMSVLAGLLAAHRDTLGPVLLARAAEAARTAGRAEMQAMIDALENTRFEVRQDHPEPACVHP